MESHGFLCDFPRLGSTSMSILGLSRDVGDRKEGDLEMERVVSKQGRQLLGEGKEGRKKKDC